MIDFESFVASNASGTYPNPPAIPPPPPYMPFPEIGEYSFGFMPPSFMSIDNPEMFLGLLQPPPPPPYMPFPDIGDYNFGFMPPAFMPIVENPEMFLGLLPPPPPSGYMTSMGLGFPEFGYGGMPLMPLMLPHPPVFNGSERYPSEVDPVTINSTIALKLPYVSNMLDLKLVASMKPTPPNFAYYVPPRVDDNDFFGGQIRIWQEKMMNCFSFFVPDVWNLQGLPEFNKSKQDGWSHFTITCKLRFCCRTCHRPWTSMRGKIHFAFKLDNIIRRGLILMKIFGQVCNHQVCEDEKFQMPACYPEEIERVLWKLSEYVGFTNYRIPLSKRFFNEPDKAIRVGNPKSPHRPSLCQACQQGICQLMGK